MMMQNRFVFVKGKGGEVRAGWGLEDKTHLDPSAVALVTQLHACDKNVLYSTHTCKPIVP